MNAHGKYISTTKRTCSICHRREAKIHLKYARLSLCEECFVKYYVNRLVKTVEKYHMFNRQDKIAIAVSGGKDSAALLHAMKTAYPDYNIFAVHIDLGIDVFSRESRYSVEKLCQILNIPLIIYSLKKEKGYTIKDLLNTRYSKRICSACSIIKRAYIRDIARENGATVLATGHNLNDTVETMITLFINGEFTNIISLKPLQPPVHPSQIKKIKPLIRHYEWESKYYVEINNLPYVKRRCPLSEGARSIRRKRILNKWEEIEPGITRQIHTVFTKKFIPIIKENDITLNTCEICDGPTTGKICSRCKIELEITGLKGDDEIP